MPTPPPAGQHAPTPAQGGPLLVTPVGTTSVATDRMQAHFEQLHSLEQQLSGATRSLVSIETSPWAALPDAPASARRSTTEIAAAIHATRVAHYTAHQLLRALHRAITAYDEADAEAHAAADRLAAVGGAQFGVLLRLGLPAIGLLGLVAWLEAKMPDPGGLRSSGMKRFLLEHPELITGPRFVHGVRMFTSGLDEGTSTFLGVPVPIAVLLGATGVTGIRSSARGLLAGRWSACSERPR